MELHAPDGLGVGRVGSIAHMVGAGNGVESLGQGRDGVSVAHPHLAVRLEAAEEEVAQVDRREMGATILAASGRLHPAAKRVADILGAVTDAQHGDAPPELTEIDTESLGVIDAVGAAGEDDTDDVRVVLREFVIRKDFTEGVEFA